MLISCHHHGEFLVNLVILGLGARGDIVIGRVRFWAFRRHCAFMLLLVECLQVSADRFT